MRLIVRCSLIAVAVAGLAACGQGNQYVAPPPAKVVVATPVKKTEIRYFEGTGNAVAVNSADLVARVPGFVEAINYADGDLVKRGTLLFTIEPESYKIKLEQARAAQEGAQATLNNAQPAFERQKALLASQSTTQANYDSALATLVSAQSSLSQARANTQLAQINYDYTQVAAPFDGIVSARQVSVGEYVGGTATPTVLATIVQSDPIWVNFSISEQDVLRLRAEMVKRGLTREDIRKVPVEIGLQNETGYPHHGTLDYVASTVNAATGTLAARAILDNPKRELLPGYFVRVRIATDKNDDALWVADVALGSDQGGPYVLVVNKDDVVEQRKVETGQLESGMRVIEKGVAPGDRVVVSGLLQAVPGHKVSPETQAQAGTDNKAQATTSAK